MRRILLPALLLLLASRPAAAFERLILTIQNEAGESLRCEAVLAHFMSQPLGTLVPGARLELELRRGTGGVLTLAPREGRDVPLENILCGSEAGWTADKGELPLSPMRSGEAASYEARCRFDAGRVTCPVEEG